MNTPPKDASALFQNCNFMLSVADLVQLPHPDRSEIAIAGRSNVGKSSLVNAPTGRKTLAKTSATPGRTQQLNFFDLAGLAYLVDMPRYGYAKVSKQLVRDWTRLIKAYLRGRPNLRLVLVLVDARHGLKESDAQILKLLDEAGVAGRIILTKADKLAQHELQQIIDKTEAGLTKYTAVFPKALLTSAHKNNGLEDLREIFFQLVS